MTEPGVEVVKWKLKCEDEAQFLREYAPKLAGLFFVAMPVPLSRGTEFPFQVKFTDGMVRIKGTALVVSVTDQPKSGVIARFVRFEPGSVQFPITSMSSEVPVPMTDVLRPSSTGKIMVRPRPSQPAPPDARPTPPSTASLDLLAASPIAPVALAPAPPPLPPPASVLAPPVAPVSAPAPAPAPALVRAPPAAPRRRPWPLLAAGVMVLSLFGVAWVQAGDGAEASRLELELEQYEQCVTDGRLTGPGGNTALDHLVAARTLAPADPRVRQRVAELSQLFTGLAQKALARGDDAEAAVHLKAVVLADPENRSAALELQAVEARVTTPHPR